MLSPTTGNFVLIRSVIIALRSIAPVSYGYLAFCLGLYLKGHKLSNTQKGVGLYAAVEAAFYLLVYLPRKWSLQKATTSTPPLTDLQRSQLFSKCRSVLPDPGYPQGWFLDTSIKRENVQRWLLWALFAKDEKIESLEEDTKEELEKYTTIVEEIMGRKLDQGYSETAKSLRLNFDPVVMQHRPLVWYFVVSAVDQYMAAGMSFIGFKHYSPRTWFRSFPSRPWTVASSRSVDPEISYWYRPHTSKTKVPIVFLHGIGIGLFMYMDFFQQIIKEDPDVGILAIETLAICNRITGPPLSAERTCDGLIKILDSLKIDRFVVISHSYGTVVTAHLYKNQNLSQRISATIFIDPIPFLLHMPAVAYNFVYRRPKKANEWQLHYFASRDPDISRTLSRYFYWTENILWKEDLKDRRVVVALSGEDQIVSAEHVRAYLTGESEIKNSWKSTEGDLEVLFYPGIDHATIFDTHERLKPILELTHKFIAGVAI